MKQLENKTMAKHQFDNTKEVSLNEFLNAKQGEKKFRKEFIHVFPDRPNGEIQIVRTVSDSDDIYENPKRVSTTIGDVKISKSGTRNAKHEGLPNHIYLTYSEAQNLLCWLRCLLNERSEMNISMDYWEINNSQMIEESKIDNETVIFKYRTRTGRQHKMTIHGQYKNDIQMMASW